METVYRIFMYIVPYAFSLALYTWVFRKVLRVPHKVYKSIAVAIVVGGLLYTLYHIFTTVRTVFTDDNFHFQIMIATVIVLFFASIAMALGEPEK